MPLWLAAAAALALAAPHRWTVPCDVLWEWYADEAGGGAASCCVEDGAGPDDVRAVVPPPHEYAVLVFRGKPRPLPWEGEHATRWSRDSATATVTLDVGDVQPLLERAAAELDDDGKPYLLVPKPTIHFHVAAARDEATYAIDPGFAPAVFAH